MKKAEMADSLYDPDYDIIVDFQEFETLLDGTINESISSFFNFLKEIKINGKVAFLTSKPPEVVISEILKRLTSKSLTVNIETFSTLEAAITILGHSIDNLELINSRLSELKQTLSERIYGKIEYFISTYIRETNWILKSGLIKDDWLVEMKADCIIE
jgi:hypothetical protein